MNAPYRQTIFTAIFIFVFCFAAFAQANENFCPKITIVLSDEFLVPGKIATFTAKVDKEAGESDVKYVWTVSRGEILKGQGSSQIELLTAEQDQGTNVTVSLTLSGLSKDCAATVSEVVSVIDIPEGHPVDEFGKITSGEKKARMDNYFIGLQNDPTAEGIIMLQNDNDLMPLLKFLSNYIKFRNFDKTRITFAITDKNKQQTQLWVVPAGAEDPKCEDCLNIKAEDFDKLEKLFQLKPKTKKRKK